MIDRLVAFAHWRRLLRSLTFDPDAAAAQLDAPGARDFIIAGIPRSGTSLLAAIVHRPPASVVCMEPWDGFRLPPAPLFESLRREIDNTGALQRGRLDIRAAERGTVGWHRDREVTYRLDLDESYLLGVKWPAYWRYLPFLPNTRFLICVRDPADTVASFLATGGRLAKGLEYDIPFHKKMNRFLENATSSTAIRRVMLYEYIASRIVPYLHSSNVLVIRYERWAQERTKLTDEISSFLDLSLEGSPVRLMPQTHATDPNTERLISRLCPSAELLGYPADG